MRQQYMSGENERVDRQTTYPPFYNENFTYLQDTLPSSFEQKLSSENSSLMKKYRSSRLFSFILLIIITIFSGLIMFPIWNLIVFMILLFMLVILYFWAIKLYVTIKIKGK